MKIQRTRYAIVTKDRKKILKNAGRYKKFCDVSGENSKSVFMTYSSRKVAESYLRSYSYKNQGDTEVVEVQEILTDDIGSVSDGYHTFHELYEHRITLYIAFCHYMRNRSLIPFWKSKKHSDGSLYEGFFILGIYKGKGAQITYHIPMKYWNDTDFADTLDKAPEYDGHSSQDVLQRIRDVFIKVSN